MSSLSSGSEGKNSAITFCFAGAIVLFSQPCLPLVENPRLQTFILGVCTHLLCESDVKAQHLCLS